MQTISLSIQKKNNYKPKYSLKETVNVKTFKTFISAKAKNKRV